MAQTRKRVNCPITGSPKELSGIVLPTRKDVLRYYNWIRLKKENTLQYKATVWDIYEDIAAKL